MSNLQPVERHEREREYGPPPSRGLNIGGTTIPWWALGVGALLLGIMGFLIYRQIKGSGTTTAQQAQNAQTATGTAMQMTPMAASGNYSGMYDLVPVPYATNTTTTGTTAAQSSGLGLTSADYQTPQVTGTQTTGAIVTPTSTAGTVTSNNNPSAESLTTSAG